MNSKSCRSCSKPNVSNSGFSNVVIPPEVARDGAVCETFRISDFGFQPAVAAPPRSMPMFRISDFEFRHSARSGGATLAQLAEHRFCKAAVVGSIPTGGSLQILADLGQPR
jgi:hypothetical protein